MINFEYIVAEEDVKFFDNNFASGKSFEALFARDFKFGDYLKPTCQMKDDDMLCSYNAALWALSCSIPEPVRIKTERISTFSCLISAKNYGIENIYSDAISFPGNDLKTSLLQNPKVKRITEDYRAWR